MFKFRKQSNQAKKKVSKSPTKGSFEWRKSYNWIFLLLPLLLGGVYLGQADDLLPIRTI